MFATKFRTMCAKMYVSNDTRVTNCFRSRKLLQNKSVVASVGINTADVWSLDDCLQITPNPYPTPTPLRARCAAL